MSQKPQAVSFFSKVVRTAVVNDMLGGCIREQGQGQGDRMKLFSVGVKREDGRENNNCESNRLLLE